MAFNTYLLSLSLFLACFNIAFSADDCVYTIYVKTGRRISGGTNSKITAKFGNQLGEPINIPNLEAWGVMGPGHDYFERGNVDVFNGVARCLNSPICSLTLASDGSQSQAGWYCEYVEITATGAGADTKQHFSINKWLTVSEPSAIRNYCSSALDDAEKKSADRIDSIVTAVI